MLYRCRRPVLCVFICSRPRDERLSTCTRVALEMSAFQHAAESAVALVTLVYALPVVLLLIMNHYHTKTLFVPVQGPALH